MKKNSMMDVHDHLMARLEELGDVPATPAWCSTRRSSWPSRASRSRPTRSRCWQARRRTVTRTCAWPNCDRPRRGRLCAMHEARRRDGRDMDTPPRDRLFDDDEIAWMRVNYPRFTFDESLRLFRLHFGREIARAQWKNAQSRYGLGKSLRWEEARFQPGHTPANKGRKGHCASGAEKGWFSKGHRPRNFLPLWSERWRTTGSLKVRILFIKVPGRSPWPAQETRDEHGNDARWVRKAVWVWEQANGPVPKGHAIVQLDGDAANCDLGNLECVSKRVLQRLNAPWAMREGREHKDLYTAQVRIAQVGEAIAQRRQEAA